MGEKPGLGLGCRKRKREKKETEKIRNVHELQPIGRVKIRNCKRMLSMKCGLKIHIKSEGKQGFCNTFEAQDWASFPLHENDE